MVHRIAEMDDYNQWCGYLNDRTPVVIFTKNAKGGQSRRRKSHNRTDCNEFYRMLRSS